MKISIVTVCYNCKKTIRRTIESVLNQKNSDVEYVIIDGESTDGTTDIIKKYDSRIAYWCSEKDNGIYDAMNKGIKKATGDIIAFMNGDDWYSDDNVFANVESYFMKTNADILYGDYYLVWKDQADYVSMCNKILDDLHYMFLFCHQALFMKRKLFDILGTYNTEYQISADYEWILRAYLKKSIFKHIPISICYYSFGGFSALHRSCCAEEGKRIKLSMLPEKKRELYYQKIMDYYEKDISKVNSIMYGVLCGNSSVICELYEELKIYDNRVIFFGAGIRGNKLLRFFLQVGVHVRLFMDNDIEKWETEIKGVKVKKPYFIPEENIKIVITFKNDIDMTLKQLIDLGYKEENIIIYDKFLENLNGRFENKSIVL